jgi:site-specific DNA recombinase
VRDRPSESCWTAGRAGRRLRGRHLSRADFARARARVETRMDTTRRRLAGQAATRTLAALPVGERALREAWESRGLNWRRAVLEAVVERVVLHPCLQGRNVFDPSRIEVVWRI